MSKNRTISDRISAALRAGKLTTSGNVLGYGINSYSDSSTNDLLNQNTSAHDDGSLHYMSELNRMFVFDNSEDKYYEVSIGNALGAVTYTFQGSTSGYVSGGSIPTYSDMIQKFSLTSDGNSSDVGDLTVARSQVSGGNSSTTHGYTTGGRLPSGYSNTIDKFPFASDGAASDVGDLTSVRFHSSSQTSSESGYVSGGNKGTSGSDLNLNIIEKFSVSADGNGSDVGDLTVGRYRLAGQSSSTHGYITGGQSAPTPGGVNIIDKFPFAADGNATDVGDLFRTTRGNAGQSSSTHGYSTAGVPLNRKIHKFSFSSDGGSTDIGNLPTGTNKSFSTGVSSTASGYAAGGQPGSPNIISKFSFSSDGDGTDVGDLHQAQSQGAGHQI